MTRPVALSILAILCALAPLPARAAPDEPSALARIAADMEAGTIGAHEALMARFHVQFRPDLLDPRYAGLDLSGGPWCATQLLAELRGHWAELSGAERHVVALATDPLYRAWVDAGGLSWEQGNADAARSAPRATCMGPEDAFPQGGPYGSRHDTEHFALFYNEGGVVTDTRIGQLAGWFEEALEIEYGEMGFYMPWNLVSFQMLVMVDYLASESVGGFTSVAACGTAGYMAYVVVNAQWFEYTQQLQSVAPHELFHAIQMRYALEELFYGDGPNSWWVEASAVFMETEVYPLLYYPQASQASRWFAEPWKSLTTYDGSGFQYGTFLFAASVRQSLETSPWFHDLWVQIEERTGYDLIEEFDLVFQEYGSDFRTEWGRFMERGATGDYDFNPYLQLDDDIVEVSVVRDHDEDDFPLDERIDGDSGLDRPEYLGINYVWFDSGGVDDDVGVIVGFDGNGSKNGQEVQWDVRLVAVEDDDPEETWALELQPVMDGDDVESWTGEVLLNDFGEDFDGLYLAVSPVTGFGDGSVTWSYSAELTDSLGDGGFMDVPEPVDDDDEGQGCDCAGSSRGGPSLGLFALAPVAARLLRRRCWN